METIIPDFLRIPLAERLYIFGILCSITRLFQADDVCPQYSHGPTESSSPTSAVFPSQITITDTLEGR